MDSLNMKKTITALTIAFVTLFPSISLAQYALPWLNQPTVTEVKGTGVSVNYTSQHINVTLDGTQDVGSYAQFLLKLNTALPTDVVGFGSTPNRVRVYYTITQTAGTSCTYYIGFFNNDNSRNSNAYDNSHSGLNGATTVTHYTSFEQYTVPSANTNFGIYNGAGTGCTATIQLDWPRSDSTGKYLIAPVPQQFNNFVSTSSATVGSTQGSTASTEYQFDIGVTYALSTIAGLLVIFLIVYVVRNK